jgi:DNA-binding transcriptional MerR regulator
MDELLTGKQAAARLGITYRHFRHLLTAGLLVLPSHPPWPGAQRRYRPADVDALVDKLARGVREGEP